MPQCYAKIRLKRFCQVKASQLGTRKKIRHWEQLRSWLGVWAVLVMTIQKFSFTPFWMLPGVFGFKLADRIHITTRSQRCAIPPNGPFYCYYCSLGFYTYPKEITPWFSFFSWIETTNRYFSLPVTYLTTQDVGLRGLCAMLRHFAGQVPSKIMKNHSFCLIQLELVSKEICIVIVFPFMCGGLPESWILWKEVDEVSIIICVHLFDHLASWFSFQ